jgi:hypothetical protein
MRKRLMNICQPENPAEFLVGGERWTIEDFADGFFDDDKDLSYYDNSFRL